MANMVVAINHYSGNQGNSLLIGDPENYPGDAVYTILWFSNSGADIVRGPIFLCPYDTVFIPDK